jgi:hypothetical protein
MNAADESILLTATWEAFRSELRYAKMAPYFGGEHMPLQYGPFFTLCKDANNHR